MRMLALKCECCGAPLDFPAGTREANCLYCNNRVLVEGASPPPAKTTPPANPAADDPRTKIAQEIAQLDREWEAYRAKYLKRDLNGQYDIPEEEYCRMGMWAAGVIAAIVILIMVGTAFQGDAVPSLIVIFFILVITAGTLAELKRQMNIARIYARSKRNYEHERLRLLGAIPSS